MAASLARTHGGRLTVLHVVVPFYLPADAPFGMAPPGDFIPEQRAHLERLVAKVLGPDGPPATVEVEVGDAAQRILDAAQRADCVVMATSGRSGLAHLLIGSVAEKVVRHATVPVLTVRSRATTRAKAAARG
jgi:universal stress protein A